ncbi:tetratricopeptide repeat protein [uncultured Lacinutrix sp.]|uniref:tetratricopeptide repeat protein n=1 Tax=uncultured Lacinutrix sp. TaxID=574032 RepID=UPI00261D51B8|nr:tetratricopeptide repeat protein [uncultured Lacinutrix sp.]
MTFSEDILQQIENYLNGNMNAEEIKAFEYQINENPELSDAVTINKKMRLQYGVNDWDFIKDDKSNEKLNALESLLKSNEFIEKRNAISNARDSYFKEEEAKNSNSNKSKLYYALAIAAVLVIFFGIFLKGKSLTNLEIYSNYNNWEELPSLVSRNETNAVLLSSGEDAFISKNYKVASEKFNTYINNEDEVNPSVLLYAGISQLELENFTSALDNFQKVIESKSIDKSKGYWYKALAYLKMDDRDKAQQQLEIIIKDTSNYNYKKAKDILNKIRE